MIGYRGRRDLFQIKPARRLEQALARGLPNPVIVGAELARDEGAAVYSRTALSFIASKLGSHKSSLSQGL